MEVPEIAKMTPLDVELYRTELEGVHVKGKGCVKPIKVLIRILYLKNTLLTIFIILDLGSVWYFEKRDGHSKETEF